MKQKATQLLRQHLSERGLKSTLQRQLILEAFIELDRHLHVDDFYPILRAKHPTIGYATVYRALKLFAEAGVAREIHFGDGITRYERALSGQHHDHLFCTACGAVTEFENRAIGQLQTEIARSHGFRVETLKIELRGVCRSCLASSPGRK